MCLFVACFKEKYASGVFVDVNGIAARTDPGILWQRAIATPAPMDDCLRCLDWSRRLRSHRSHRSNATSWLGSGNNQGAAIRVWRLVALCVSHAVCLRHLKKMAPRAPTSGKSLRVALLLLTFVLRCLGQLRPGITFDPDSKLCPPWHLM